MSMYDHVIESIGRWGVVTTPYQARIGLVKPGDIIEVPEALRRYPCTGRYSRIASIDDGIAHICEGMGSAHLLKDGSCDISGGPWWSMPTSLMEPTYSLHQASYWNWGGNSPGAAQGVYYAIWRPLHRITVHPDDLKYRHAVSERDARKGRFLHDEPLDEARWSLLFKGKQEESGEVVWVFRRRLEA